MVKSSVIIFSVLVALFPLLTEGQQQPAVQSPGTMDCYVCNNVNFGCTVWTFQYNQMEIQVHPNCRYCIKSFYNLDGTDYVNRACGTDNAFTAGCIETTVNGYQGVQCLCNTETCNSATHISSFTGILLAVAVAAMRFCF